MSLIPKKQAGFTIVELLIVIVVIAILATISIVAYNGIQSRTRDTARTAAAKQLQKALAAYFALNGKYPSITASGVNVPAGFSGVYGTGYEYSVATNDTWMKKLIDSGLIPKAPIDPANDNNHYFAYYASDSYGKCTQPFYMLAVIGYENSANIPSDSQTLTCTYGGATASWIATSSRGIFSNITTPPDP